MDQVASRENTSMAMGHQVDSATLHKFYASEQQHLDFVTLRLNGQLQQTETLNKLYTPLLYRVQDTSQYMLSKDEHETIYRLPEVSPLLKSYNELRREMEKEYGKKSIDEWSEQHATEWRQLIRKKNKVIESKRNQDIKPKIKRIQNELPEQLVLDPETGVPKLLQTDSRPEQSENDPDEFISILSQICNFQSTDIVSEDPSPANPQEPNKISSMRKEQYMWLVARNTPMANNTNACLHCQIDSTLPKKKGLRHSVVPSIWRDTYMNRTSPNSGANIIMAFIAIPRNSSDNILWLAIANGKSCKCQICKKDFDTTSKRFNRRLRQHMHAHAQEQNIQDLSEEGVMNSLWAISNE